MRVFLAAALTACTLSATPADQARALLRRGIDTMGGEARLQAIKGLKITGLGRTAWLEQSERPEGPLVHSYEQFTEWQDFEGSRLRRESSVRGLQPLAWNDSSLVAVQGAGAFFVNGRAFPAQGSQLDDAAQALAMNPARLMLAALAANDLAVDPETALFGTPHPVIRFQAGGLPVRLLLNPHTGLPDAVETTRTFRGFWGYWGDVRQRIVWGDWELEQGIRTPRLWEEFRNGQPWREWTLTAVELNPAAPEKGFDVDSGILEASRKAAVPSPLSIPFSAAKATEPFPGIVVVPGAWNTALVATEEGVTILEAPISEAYFQSAMEEAARRFPGRAIQGVVSTSDSWPHHGGVRGAVAAGLPVTALDLTLPLLDRIVKAPWTLRPDRLQKAPRAPKWHRVSGRMSYGRGPNRMEFIPIRGNTTERQMLVYFPERKLLYAADTIALLRGQLFNPAQVDEVVRAVAREGLEVETVFAMHAAPLPWKQVLDALKQ